MNSVQLIGRLTHDPEPQATPNDTRLTTFRLAVDHPRRQLANFITVKAWGRLAEVAAEHLARGRRVAVWGSLEHEQWTTKRGARRERLVVLATRVEFLDPPPIDAVNRRAEADGTAPPVQTARSGAVAPATPAG
jgi:single-strand DNA-binding protein